MEDVQTGGGSGEQAGQKVEDDRQVATKFKAKRLSLGLTQKQVVVNMRNLMGSDLKVQIIDVAKFELNHSQQSMAKFLPLAQAWLQVKATSQTTLKSSNLLTHTPPPSSPSVQVKAEPVAPQEQPSSPSVKASPKVSCVPTPKSAASSLPRVDIVKLKLSPTHFSSPINLVT